MSPKIPTTGRIGKLAKTIEEETSMKTQDKLFLDFSNSLAGENMGVLVITHYQRLLNYIKPQFVHIMLGGRIVESGGAELALQLEEHGYEWVREKYNNGLAA